jgi:hypothetical protein
VKQMAADLESLVVVPPDLPAGTGEYGTQALVMGGTEAKGQAPGGLKKDNMDILYKLHDGMAKLATDMRDLSGKFANADALNKATSHDLLQVMGDFNGMVEIFGAAPPVDPSGLPSTTDTTGSNTADSASDAKDATSGTKDATSHSSDSTSASSDSSKDSSRSSKST